MGLAREFVLLTLTHDGGAEELGGKVRARSQKQYERPWEGFNRQEMIYCV